MCSNDFVLDNSFYHEIILNYIRELLKKKL